MADAAAGRRLLRAAGFRIWKRRIFEANTLFDTSRGALRRCGCLLRVREAGRQGVLTYKGTQTPGKHKDREELEVEVSNAPQVSTILSRLGLKAGFRYEKYRTEFKRAGEKGVATLDETPVGVYLELEGAPSWIDRTAKRMGFQESDYILTSYYGLYVAYCRDQGFDPNCLSALKAFAVIRIDGEPKSRCVAFLPHHGPNCPLEPLQ